MSKLIMWNVITLDGYFDGDQLWELPFHQVVWGDELEALSLEQLRSAECLVFGRATYEGMAAYWKNETGEIAKRKKQSTKDLYVFGSADLCETLLKDDLFDELRICIAPVILGSGRPLFKKGSLPKTFSLLSTQPLETGGVVLRYAKI